MTNKCSSHEEEMAVHRSLTKDFPTLLLLKKKKYYYTFMCTATCIPKEPRETWALNKPHSSEVTISSLINTTISGLKHGCLTGHSNATQSQEAEKKICPRCVHLMQNICAAVSLEYTWSQVQENEKVKKVTTKETTGQCQVKGHKTNEKHIKWLTHWHALIANWPPSKCAPRAQYQKLSKERMKMLAS